MLFQYHVNLHVYRKCIDQNADNTVWNTLATGWRDARNILRPAL